MKKIIFKKAICFILAVLLIIPSIPARKTKATVTEDTVNVIGKSFVVGNKTYTLTSVYDEDNNKSYLTGAYPYLAGLTAGVKVREINGFMSVNGKITDMDIVLLTGNSNKKYDYAALFFIVDGATATLDLSSGYKFNYVSLNLKKFIGNNYAIDENNKLVALAYHDKYNNYLTTDKSLGSENIRLVREAYYEYTDGLSGNYYPSCKGSTEALFEIKTDTGYEYVKFNERNHFKNNFSVAKVNDTENNKTSVSYFESGVIGINFNRLAIESPLGNRLIRDIPDITNTAGVYSVHYGSLDIEVSTDTSDNTVNEISVTSTNGADVRYADGYIVSEDVKISILNEFETNNGRYTNVLAEATSKDISEGYYYESFGNMVQNLKQVTGSMTYDNVDHLDVEYDNNEKYGNVFYLEAPGAKYWFDIENNTMTRLSAYSSSPQTTHFVFIDDGTIMKYSGGYGFSLAYDKISKKFTLSIPTYSDFYFSVNIKGVYDAKYSSYEDTVMNDCVTAILAKAKSGNQVEQYSAKIFNMQNLVIATEGTEVVNDNFDSVKKQIYPNLILTENNILYKNNVKIKENVKDINSSGYYLTEDNKLYSKDDTFIADNVDNLDDVYYKTGKKYITLTDMKELRLNPAPGPDNVDVTLTTNADGTVDASFVLENYTNDVYEISIKDTIIENTYKFRQNGLYEAILVNKNTGDRISKFVYVTTCDETKQPIIVMPPTINVRNNVLSVLTAENAKAYISNDNITYNEYTSPINIGNNENKYIKVDGNKRIYKVTTNEEGYSVEELIKNEFSPENLKGFGYYYNNKAININDSFDMAEKAYFIEDGKIYEDYSSLRYYVNNKGTADLPQNIYSFMENTLSDIIENNNNIYFIGQNGSVVRFNNIEANAEGPSSNLSFTGWNISTVKTLKNIDYKNGIIYFSDNTEVSFLENNSNITTQALKYYKSVEDYNNNIESTDNIISLRNSSNKYIAAASNGNIYIYNEDIGAMLYSATAKFDEFNTVNTAVSTSKWTNKPVNIEVKIPENEIVKCKLDNNEKYISLLDAYRDGLLYSDYPLTITEDTILKFTTRGNATEYNGNKFKSPIDIINSDGNEISPENEAGTVTDISNYNETPVGNLEKTEWEYVLPAGKYSVKVNYHSRFYENNDIYLYNDVKINDKDYRAIDVFFNNNSAKLVTPANSIEPLSYDAASDKYVAVINNNGHYSIRKFNENNDILATQNILINNIDTVSPNVIIQYNSATNKIEITASDTVPQGNTSAESGISKIYYLIETETSDYQEYTVPIERNVKKDMTIKAYAVDNAGNKSLISTKVIDKDIVLNKNITYENGKTTLNIYADNDKNNTDTDYIYSIENEIKHTKDYTDDKKNVNIKVVKKDIEKEETVDIKVAFTDFPLLEKQSNDEYTVKANIGSLKNCSYKKMYIQIDNEDIETVEDLSKLYKFEEGRHTVKVYQEALVDNTDSLIFSDTKEYNIVVENIKVPEPPTEAPTEKPTEAPTEAPTKTPTEKPTEAPTETPADELIEKPTEIPTDEPADEPDSTEYITPSISDDVPTGEHNLVVLKTISFITGILLMITVFVPMKNKKIEKLN